MAKSVYPYTYSNESKSLSFDALSKTHTDELIANVKDSLSNGVPRMSGAFPTFRLLFIEEDAPQWGFYDDLYGYDSVKSISIHKSRKQAADTAVVEITNFRGVLDNKNFQDADHADTAKDDVGRKNGIQDEVNKMFIRPGLRVKIQLGNSSHDEDLDNTFTGIVTEVQYGDIITFVAQGYGQELLYNVGLSFYESLRRATWKDPKHLIASITTSKYARHLGRRGLKNKTQEAGEGEKNRAITSNPIDDNVFLVDGGFLSFWMDDSKWIRQFKLYHTTAWEALQDITRRFPGYITSVVPFDNRGTLFFGIPDQPYFFTATNDANTRKMFENSINTSVAKKALSDGEPLSEAKDLNAKVFRSYHMKDSEHHIIANNIKINLDNFYNKVTIEYKVKPGLGVKLNGSFPLSADDTMPEKYIKEKVIYEQNCESDLAARSYALGNLILCTKEAYDGELIMLGDPSIKPHDTIVISDSYNRMHGPIEVREVIHNFDREAGFTTTVVPDLVVHINNPFKLSALAVSALKQFAVMHSPFGQTTDLIAKALSSISKKYAPDNKRNNMINDFWQFVIYAKAGWRKAHREPIGISPLIYNGKPYIAGFEGMKSEDWMTRTWEQWVKAAGELKAGTQSVYKVLGFSSDGGGEE